MKMLHGNARLVQLVCVILLNFLIFEANFNEINLLKIIYSNKFFVYLSLALPAFGRVHVSSH